MSELDKDQVNGFFRKAAILHRNENAVLDVAEGQEHSNIYRNYFTANYILQNLQLKSNEIILDFGCGVGRVSKLIAEKSFAVVGVDTNSEMIKIAKEKFSLNNKVRYQTLTKITVESKDDYFDKAFSHWVFQHINDEDSLQWLFELKRVIKSNGKIFLFEQIKNESAESAKHMFRSPKHYLSLIEKAELKTISAFPVMRVPARGMSLWNKLPAWKFLLPIVSFIDNLTLNRKPELAGYYTYCFVLSK